MRKAAKDRARLARSIQRGDSTHTYGIHEPVPLLPNHPKARAKRRLECETEAQVELRQQLSQNSSKQRRVKITLPKFRHGDGT